LWENGVLHGQFQMTVKWHDDESVEWILAGFVDLTPVCVT